MSDVEQVRGDAVVQIVRVVGDAVGEVRHLSFQRGIAVRFLPEEWVVRIAGMFADTLLHFPGQIQSVKLRVAFFQHVDDAQALPVVFEPAVVLHQFIEHVLSGMAERRMPEIVRQRDGFRQVFVQLEGFADRPGDLRHLQRMREARPVIIALVIHKYLGFVLQLSERGGVDDPVAIPLEPGAVGMLLFGMSPAPAFPAFDRIRGQVFILLGFDLLTIDHGFISF